MRPTRPCTQPGCSQLVVKGRCPEHRKQAERRRGTAAERGYDHRWRESAADYFTRHPTCALDGCDQAATVRDHWPTSRRQLVAQGVTDPDADEHLRPLCSRHHNEQTARNQPGGFRLA